MIGFIAIVSDPGEIGSKKSVVRLDDALDDDSDYMPRDCYCVVVHDLHDAFLLEDYNFSSLLQTCIFYFCNIVPAA